MFNLIKSAMKFVIKTIANIIMLPFSYFRNKTQVPAPVYHSSSSVIISRMPERRMVGPVMVPELLGEKLYNPGVNGFILPSSNPITLTRASPNQKLQDKYDRKYEQKLASYYSKVRPEFGRYSMKNVKF